MGQVCALFVSNGFFFSCIAFLSLSVSLTRTRHTHTPYFDKRGTIVALFTHGSTCGLCVYQGPWSRVLRRSRERKGNYIVPYLYGRCSTYIQVSVHICSAIQSLLVVVVVVVVWWSFEWQTIYCTVALLVIVAWARICACVVLDLYLGLNLGLNLDLVVDLGTHIVRVMGYRRNSDVVMEEEPFL